MPTDARESNAPPLPIAKSPFLPIEVICIIMNDSVVVYPNRLTIPWGYQGTIVWTLACGDPLLDFADPGIKFLDGTPAQFQVLPNINPRQCQVSVKNMDTDKTGDQFHYDLLFTSQGKKSKFDPTVENDPPTP